MYIYDDKTCVSVYVYCVFMCVCDIRLYLHIVEHMMTRCMSLCIYSVCVCVCVTYRAACIYMMTSRNFIYTYTAYDDKTYVYKYMNCVCMCVYVCVWHIELYVNIFRITGLVCIYIYSIWWQDICLDVYVLCVCVCVCDIQNCMYIYDDKTYFYIVRICVCVAYRTVCIYM